MYRRCKHGFKRGEGFNSSKKEGEGYLLMKISNIKENRMFKCLYILTIGFMFWCGIINNLLWINKGVFMNIFSNYYDETLIVFSAFLLVIEGIDFFHKFKNQEIEKNSFKREILFVVILFLTYISTQRKIWCVYVILLHLARYFKFNVLVKTYIFSKLFAVIIWVILGLAGFIGMRHDLRGLSLGMYHYNDVAFTISYLFLSIWYLYLKDKKMISIILVLGICGFCYYPLTSRTPILMLLTFIFMIIIKSYVMNLNGILGKLKNLVLIYYPLLMYFIAIGVAAIPATINHHFDVSFYYRFKEIKMFYDVIGIPLTRPEISHSPIILDNTYAHFIYKLGLIFTVISLIYMILSNKKIIEDGNVELMMISVFLYSYGQMEYIVKGDLLFILIAYYFAEK